MTSQKPPAHGTLYRYAGAKNGSWPPCRCPKCTAFHSRACKVRWIERVNGNPGSLPAAPVAAHIDALRASGMTYQAIASQANVARGTISRTHQGLSTFLHRESAQRILAVKPASFDDKVNQPALGTVRRIRALYVIGHGAKAISSASGIEEATISLLANGHWPTVRGATAAAIRQAYQALVWTPGAGAKAKRRAANLGWHGPLSWGGDMDDPATQPDADKPYTPPAKNGRDSLRMVELEHLLALGESEASIAKQMGASEDYIHDLAVVIRNRRKTDVATAA